MFTDTHSHIHFSREFPDIDGILRRAEEAKVTRQIIVGCTPKDSFQALDFVKKHADRSLWSTLGVHPHNADQLNDEILARYRDVVKTEKKIVALGEMGLDYFRNLQQRDVQIAAFRRQLELAAELDLPVVVHVRDAWDDALKIISETGNKKVVLHCFTGMITHAKLCWERGYYTSFSGIVTYPKNQALRDIAIAAPDDKILIETDCPYLTPQPYRGKRNEPAYIVETARTLAEARGVSLEEIARQTTENAVRLFGIS